MRKTLWRAIGIPLPVLLLAGLLWGGGCSALPFMGDSDGQRLQVQVQGQPEMNSGGNAAVVRVYQLSAPTNFKRIPLSTFWKDDEQGLGDELISTKEVLLYPKEAKSIAFEIDEKTTYIGVAADLRAPAREQWRVIYPVSELQGKDLATTVMADRVQVEVK